MMSEAWIIDACRSPRAAGKPGKSAYGNIHPQRLAADVLGALVVRNEVSTADIDDVVLGTTHQRGLQSKVMARSAALLADFDVSVAGTVMDRFCASGLSATSYACASVAAGFDQLIIAGGCEMQSTYGVDPSKSFLMDGDNPELRKKYPQHHQGLSADLVATLDGIDRAALDAVAANSQVRAQNAIAGGYFDRSIIPISGPDGELLLDKDALPRPGTSFESLQELQPSFPGALDFKLNEEGLTYRDLIEIRYPDTPINHVHHAGNSSQLADAAAAILIANSDYAKSHELKPRARIKAAVSTGDDPVLMLNAPVPATRKALSRAGMDISDIDLFEVNEAFAVVTEKYVRDLGISHEQVNVNGGAIALGHPIGATGPILTGTLLDELERRDLNTGLVCMCAAGGMGTALIIERV